MKPYARIVVLVAASALLAACSPARTGVVNGTLTTNLRPAISISANAPLALADSGRVWVSPKTHEVLGAATASFDYAVYTDSSASPAAKFAYAAIIRLEDMKDWNFVPQGKSLPGSFSAKKKVDPQSREGTLYTLHVPSAGDWASEFLAVNGIPVPGAWIAKRWVFSLDTGFRALAEYREPWPADLEIPDSDIILLRDSQAEFLREFERRAIASFAFDPAAGDFAAAPPAAAWKQSPVLPDVAKLAGEIIYNDRSGRDVSKD